MRYVHEQPRPRTWPIGTKIGDFEWPLTT